MNLSVGIVGLPNAGKSTLFNALLKKQAALAAAYPFATIEPNIGVVEVPDPRLEILAKIVETEKIVPAIIKFVDIAGLVRGAHKGEGLGNKFLSHIREVDAICYVLRFFNDPKVIHINNRVDPKEDLAILNEELILADYQTLAKQIEPKKNADKNEWQKWEIINMLKRHLNKGLTANTLNLEPAQKELIKPLNLLTLKPVIYVANLDEEQLKQSGEVLAKFPARPLIPLSAEIESAQNGPALDTLAKTAYQTLNLISFLTAGSLEARAWTIKKGTTAQQAAGVIHSDFVQKFVKAQIVDYDDFVRAGGWNKSRKLGLVKQEGRDYIMPENKVVEFKING